MFAANNYLVNVIRIWMRFQCYNGAILYRGGIHKWLIIWYSSKLSNKVEEIGYICLGLVAANRRLGWTEKIFLIDIAF